MKRQCFQGYFIQWAEKEVVHLQLLQKSPPAHMLGRKGGTTMDQSLHTPKPYDYRQYDRIWQRVAPELEPYPGWKEQAVPALADLTPSGGTSGTLGGAGTAAQGG